MSTAITIYLIIGITLTFSEVYFVADSRNTLKEEPLFHSIVSILFTIFTYPCVVVYYLIRTAIANRKTVKKARLIKESVSEGTAKETTQAIKEWQSYLS